jgi:hypothetical protein
MSLVACKHGFPIGYCPAHCIGGREDTWPENAPPLEGRKDDGGKDPWHLVPWDAVRGIVKILAFGAKKYGDRNWEKGMDWSRPYAALIRHLTAWWNGEKADAETGYSHLWHAGCCILFLIAYELRGTGHDDRPVPAEPKEWR